jgi:putative ABC transport system permease protein
VNATTSKNGDSDDFILRDAAAVQRAQAHSAWIVALMLVAAAAVALVVAGVGIMNLMLVSVRERRQEIGVRMAVGARRRDIALQFLIEAALLALFGSVTGVVLGLVGGAAIGTAAALWNSQTLVAILAAVSSATAITLVSALYPSLQASHLDPAEALADA